MRKHGIIAGSIGIAVLAGAALRGVLRRFEIKESSMEPTLTSGDWVIARRRTTALVRADVVVFDDPAGTGMNLVKRVIGVAGETIGIENGRVTIDGIVLADRWANGVTEPNGEWAINDGEVWVLGDNRPLSRSDSRRFGAVRDDTITWQIAARYWPTKSAGMIA